MTVIATAESATKSLRLLRAGIDEAAYDPRREAELHPSQTSHLDTSDFCRLHPHKLERLRQQCSWIDFLTRGKKLSRCQCLLRRRVAVAAGVCRLTALNDADSLATTSRAHNTPTRTQRQCYLCVEQRGPERRYPV
ncbi:unnamed protein product [Sphagnum jensenii]|uniref:Uncharacterized protein n=1 Tax=Sphagnum jensenii TaxID=128206 RepID=A0ABP0VII2_9BRYO